MDTVTSINKLRAQFLSTCPDQDQMRRVIKPFIPDDIKNRELLIEREVRDIYGYHNGRSRLEKLESPPISKNWMDNYTSIGKSRLGNTRKERNIISPTKTREKSILEDEDDEFDEKLIKELSVQQELQETFSNEHPNEGCQNSDEINGATGKLKNRKNTSPSLSGTKQSKSKDYDTTSNTNKNGVGLLNNNLNSNPSTNNIPHTPDSNADSDSSGSIKKQGNNKRPTLRFPRLFKGRKDSASGNTNNNSTGNSTSNNDIPQQEQFKKVSAEALIRKGSTTAASIFDMNFDYDEDLDEEEDDDDDDEEGEDDDGTLDDFNNSFFQMSFNGTAGKNNNNSASSVIVKRDSFEDANDFIASNDKITENHKSSGGHEKKNSTSKLDKIQTANDDDDNINTSDLSANVTNTSEGTNNQDKSNSNNNNADAITNKKRSHFSNMISRNPLIDSSKNNVKPEKTPLGRNKSDNTIKTSLPSDLKNDLGKSSTNTSAEINSTVNSELEEDEDDENDMFDLFSFMNERKMSNIDMEDRDSLSAGSSLTKQKSILSPHIDESIMRDEVLTPDGLDVLDSESSFGKSLLYSEFSNDDFSKESHPRGRMNIDSIRSDIGSLTIPSHSIPAYLDSYGMYHGQDDSILDTVFDKAAQRIKSTKIDCEEDIKNVPFSLPDHSIHGTTSRRPSNTSSVQRQHSQIMRHHNRSHSSNGRDYRRVFKGIDKVGDKEFKRSRKGSNESKLDSNLISKDLTTRRDSSVSMFITDKPKELPKPPPSVSQLSKLFNKKKEKKQDTSEILEYFSFVSGSNVPKNESISLNIFLQNSKKYQHNPFELNVRKTASVFEVIGYVLFKFITEFKPDNIEEDGLQPDLLRNPNNFSLHIVEEDGEPFEDNFGKLDRKISIQSISDNEVVLCLVNENERNENSIQTPLPFDVNGDIIDTTTNSNTDSKNETSLNQLSYYKPIVGLGSESTKASNTNTIEIKVYLYPNKNPKYNFTTIKVPITSNINDILVSYCKMKNMYPNEYSLLYPSKKMILDLNDTVLRLDGNHEVELISKKEARSLHLQKMKPDMKKPVLPTIQSNDLTPLTLEPAGSYLKPDNEESISEAQEVASTTNSSNTGKDKDTLTSKKSSKFKKQTAKMKLNLTSTTNASNAVNGLFKTKNSSKTSLHNPLPFYHTSSIQAIQDMDTNAENTGDSAYQDLVSGAYHKYKVWRRQQMAINKHERTLALDGDYIYIIPPDKHMHWHENVKTKSIHISRVILVKRSNRVPVNFKIFVEKGEENNLKRYYFEAVSSEECKEIVARIQNLQTAYRMNHK
ncbi:hypothetical protein TBLA_0F01080 [Henningerozyma blattae CBS 6284]|uniref:Uncharacterized protein n=1 Tax=Henningerozyma blattae (strain ATCC 34711 / CBS 6284 / DSM 70876 / NBRC 10599 / NRRL Y-10934 / UCD 77-7) TaxID=1071380 RepID=I2H5J9_HENB6|nr:hypothetical protein TBLA_0F01080 [Tetrapisispora blattae CBS 6284]CCH61651.1 hypothetical protein TBLA_0F01080 [Tetrapisispora blattae CBS 6284]